VVIGGKMRPHHGAGAGDVGGGKRRTVQIRVVAVGGHAGGKDRRAGRAEVHVGGAIIGESGQIVGARGGGHREDVVQLVAGGIERSDVVVGAGVAGGGDEDDIGLAQAGDGVVEALGGEGGAAPTG